MTSQGISITTSPKVEQALLGVGIVLSLVFWGNIGFGFYTPYPGSFLIKWVPCGILAFIIFRKRQDLQEFLAFCAVLLLSVGAVIIDFDRAGNVLPALMFTLAGHGTFCFLYFRDWRARSGAGQALSRARLLVIGAIALYAVCYGSFLGYHLFQTKPGLAIPVMLYMAVLPGAAALSVAAGYSTRLVSVGALCFVVQDSIFGWHLFIQPFPGNYFLIWPLFITGHFLFTLGYLRSRQSAG